MHLVPLFAQTTTPQTTTPADPIATVGMTVNDWLHLAETYGIPVLKAVVLFVVGLLIAKWVARLIRASCERARFDRTLGGFLASLAQWLVIAAVVTMCLSSFGVQVTSLVALLGTIGVAIGLALQGSLSHIASGVMLLIFRPFKVGDLVTAGGQTGIVEEIALFNTLMVTPDNRRILVPNGAIVGTVIVNSTHFSERLIDISVQADPAGSIETQRQALLAAASAVPGRLPTRPAATVLTALAPNHTFTVAIWCKTTEIDAVRERLLIACDNALAEHHLAPPPPVQLVRHVQ